MLYNKDGQTQGCEIFSTLRALLIVSRFITYKINKVNNGIYVMGYNEQFAHSNTNYSQTRL